MLPLRSQRRRRRRRSPISARGSRRAPSIGRRHQNNKSSSDATRPAFAGIAGSSNDSCHSGHGLLVDSEIQMSKDGSLLRRDSSVAESISSRNCTQETADETRRLLFGDTCQSKSSNREQARTTHASKKQSHSRRNCKNETAHAVKVFEDGLRLDHRQRIVLATDIINVTLHLLTTSSVRDATQAQTPNDSHVDALGEGAACQLSHREPHSTAARLQDLSPNCRTSRATKAGQSQSKSRSDAECTQASSLDMITSAAECARAAFEFLRSLASDATAMPKGPSLPVPQIEDGMLAFCGRLISLDLYDLAVKELRVLKTLLGKSTPSTHVSRPTKGVSKAGSNEAQKPTSRETLATLLDILPPNKSAPTLQRIVDFQVLVLKLLVARRRPAVVQAAFEYLDLARDASPVNLMLCLSNEQGTKEKMARSLENLSQLVFALCPKLNIADDAEACDPSKSPPPATSFFMQTLALRIRLTWAPLVNYSRDVEREAWKPFARCLATFIRRSSQSERDKYSTAEKCFKDLQGDLQSQRPSPAFVVGNGASLFEVWYKLSILAEAAHMNQQAEHWMELLLDETPRIQSSTADQSLYRTRRQSLALKIQLASHDDEMAIQSMENISHIVKGDYSLKNNELDNYLREALSIRHSILSLLKRSYSENPPKTTSGTSVERAAQDVLVSFIRFFCKALASLRNDLSSATQDPPGFEKLKDVALRFVEALLLGFKRTENASQCMLEFLDHAMQSSISLLRICDPVEDDVPPNPLPAPQNSPSLYIKISHVYWTAYSRMERPLPTELEKHILTTLRAACEVLLTRPASEKDTGQLALKLYELGRMFDQRGDQKNAEKYLRQSVATAVETGDNNGIASKAASIPLERLFECDELQKCIAKALKRLLETKAKLRTVNSSGSLFYDDDTLQIEQRALLVEYQLHTMSKWADTKELTAFLLLAAPVMAKSLLQLYDSKNYPIRRRRVVLMLCRLSERHGALSSLGSDALLAELENESAMRVAGRDTGLMEYRDHLQASCNALLSLRKWPSQKDKLVNAIYSWSRLLDDCKTSTTLTEKVFNVTEWKSQVGSLADFLEMQGCHDLRLSALQLLAKVVGLASEANHEERVAISIKVSLQLLHYGYTEEAGRLLNEVQERLQSCPDSIAAKLQLHLACVDYYATLGDHKICDIHLKKIQALSSDPSFASLQSWLPENLPGSIAKSIVFAECLRGYSIGLQEIGVLPEALMYGLCSLNLLERAWKTVEEHVLHETETMRSNGNRNDGIASLSEDLASLNLSVSSSDTRTKFEASSSTSSFWPLITRLFRENLRLAAIFQDQGIYQRCFYLLGKGKKLVESVHAESLLAEVETRHAELCYRSQNFEEGRRCLVNAERLCKQQGLCREEVSYHVTLGLSHHQQQQWKEELSAYQQAEELLSSLKTRTRGCSSVALPPKGSQNVPVVLSGNANERSLAGKKRVPNTSKAAKQPPADAASNEFNGDNFLRFGDILQLLRAECMMMQGRNADAFNCLASVRSEGRILKGSQYFNTCARHRIREAVVEMYKDAVHGMLPDSTLSLPSIVPATTGASSSDDSILETLNSKDVESGVVLHYQRKERQGCSGRQAYAESLHEARELAKDVVLSSVKNFSSRLLTQSASTFAKASLMLSFTQNDASGERHSPAAVTHSLGLPQALPFLKERLANAIEMQRKDGGELFSWPTKSQIKQLHDAVPHGQLQTSISEVLAPGWTVISLLMDENFEHLYITKCEADKSPFILWLPLHRQNEDDPSESFTFKDAKAELSKIISLSDATVAQARDKAADMDKKGAKTSWWVEREALDQRLQDLLLNIENMWLGGFRGIFSQQRCQLELLARFQRSFELILGNNLPSRQRQQKGRKSSSVQLDPRVFELFVNLGNPAQVEFDLEEALTDLLYYVVDILQFNGESNAYDEIDFDSMAVQVQDALLSYHDAVQQESAPSPHHTILVLDKQLHGFPWESLRCLEGQSVTRAFSFADLHERLEAAKQSAHLDRRGYGIHVSPKCGTYILNPSGDLVTSQARLEETLKALTGPGSDWSHITAREPSEDEFLRALSPAGSTTPDTSPRRVLLYFGHGSGAQYVRQRRIQQLYHAATHDLHLASPPPAKPGAAAGSDEPQGQRPARPPQPTASAALLFGCSSASLREVGEFEPYGVPRTYMLAGAPAVLGSLWDVTDGDLDAFALGALRRWGLLSGDDGAAKAAAGDKGAGSRRRQQRRRRRGDGRSARLAGAEDAGDGGGGAPCSLSDAVARSRGECYLRYLNGAAMVVYGVPVYVAPS